MKHKLLENLTEEQLAKAKLCKNTKEVLELIKEEGVELTQEQLEAVNGGGCTTYDKTPCPACGYTGPHRVWMYTTLRCGRCYEYIKDIEQD